MRVNLKLVKPSPAPVNGTVPPKEVERLIKASRARGRYGARDALAILMAYRHGLRASEFAELRWDQVNFDHGLLHVRRKKNGMPSVHPIPGDELRALRALRREHDAARYVFMTERGAAEFRKMLARTGQEAKFPFLVHPHMLRHACGFKLANDGQDTRALQHYLGHKNIQHTVRYTELSPGRFKNFWD
jgi:type 1 fimbriae regulatory protein FimB/type 1 fimbriae regulatory protein FimE